MSAVVSFAEKPVLSDELVTLQPMRAEHAAELFAVILDAESMRLTGTHATFTFEQIERWAATRAEQPDRLDFAVVRNATGAVVGDLAVNDLDTDNRSCGFRIALLASAAGQGLGTAATRLIVEYLLGLGVHRIELEVYDFNPRARHVYEKVDFVHEGTKRDALLWDGQWIDAHLMAIVAPH